MPPPSLQLYLWPRVILTFNLVHLGCCDTMGMYCNMYLPGLVTSSSAIAKRLRDALYLSVVSFNITKRRAQSFIVTYVGYRFIIACN